MHLFQEVVQKEVTKALNETKDHIADLMAVVVEKFDELKDGMDRGFEAVGEKFEEEHWETPQSSHSSHGGPTDTPKRTDKSKRRSRCPFCRRLECKDPVACGLKLKWSSRMVIHKREGLCADRCCYKRHAGKCHKFEQTRCSHCERKHIALWCILKAKQEKMV